MSEEVGTCSWCHSAPFTAHAQYSKSQRGDTGWQSEKNCGKCQLLVSGSVSAVLALQADRPSYTLFPIGTINVLWAGQLSRCSDWLRAERSGNESRWGRDFPPVQTSPGAHPASCTMGTGSFPGVKCGRGVLLTTHPLLVPRSWKSRTVPLPTTPAVTGSLYLFTVNVLIYEHQYTSCVQQ